jgi:predicted TIM-barrel fold metal-dependent hydrolase
MDTLAPSPTPAVLQGIAIVDADTHITEPHDLFTARAPAKYKDRVPQVKVVNGEGHWVIDGDKVIGSDMGCAAVLRDGSKVGAEFFEKKIEDIHRGAYDVKARLQYMDEAGITAQIGYGNLFGFAAGNNGLCDSDLRIVSLQIYNDFLAEFQEQSGNRIFPMMLMPWWDVKEAVAEVKRCRKMGLRGINTHSDPHLAGMPTLGESYWNPLWEVCTELDLPVNFHIGSSDASQTWYGSGAWPTLKTPAEQLAFGTNMMLMSNLRVVANIIMSGFLENFPTLKIVSVESGVGWLPMMLESLEYQMQQNSLKYKTPPLEVFRRQMYACAWFERRNFVPEVRALGADCVMFETDFPHPTCLYPDALLGAESIAAEFTPDERRKVFGGTAARIYNIPV